MDDLNDRYKTEEPSLPTGRPTTTVTFDDAGRATSVTNPVGAVTETAYDMLDRPRSTTSVIRQPGGAPSVRATTSEDYDDLNNLTSRTTPLGNTWTYQYNANSDLTGITDPRTKTWAVGYDLADRVTSFTDPLQRATTYGYDLAGRLTATSQLDRNGATLTSETYDHDAAGNLTQTTDGNGHATTRSYDAGNRLLTITQPVDATHWRTTGFGYDAGGLLTRSTDGRGYTTDQSPSRTADADNYDVYYTYTSWGQRQDLIEPSTAGQTDLSDRSWTTSYDDAGEPVAETQPGGITVARAFDAVGELTNETGSDPNGTSATASRTYGYDLAGQLQSVNNSSGTETFSYDDRGLLTDVAGPAGSTHSVYDNDGQLQSRTDPAGTHQFTWKSNGQLGSETDPLTGTTLTYSYDAAAQPQSIDYQTAGATTATRSFDYNDLGELTGNTLAPAGGAATNSVTFGYDDNGNLTRQTYPLRATRLPANTATDMTGRTGSPRGPPRTPPSPTTGGTGPTTAQASTTPPRPTTRGAASPAARQAAIRGRHAER